jgi:hypothetical protein
MPPTVTALCAPNTAEFAWKVSSSEVLNDYNVDASFTAGASFPVEEFGATQPYTFDTKRPGGTGSSYGEVVNLEWHDDPGLGMSDPANSDPYTCVTPQLTVTTDCAFKGGLPDGNVSFTGGVQGMLFSVNGPDTDGFSGSPITTASDGTGVGYGTMEAGSYQYAYVVPGSKLQVDGSFTIGTCPPS